MGTFEEFEQDLQDALIHLYDPAYEPSPLLSAVLGCSREQGYESVQAALAQSVRTLRPAPEVPSGARVRRVYEVLAYRYLEKLTQEETAERLAMSSRHLRREQKTAVRLLGERLWTQREPRTPLAEGDVQAPEAELDVGASDWRSQVRLEMASLQKSAPDSVADVAEAVRSVVELARPLASKHGVGLGLGSVQPDLVAMAHPSALRQILLGAIIQLMGTMSGGRIELSARSEVNRLQIIIAADRVIADGLTNGYPADELLAAAGGWMTCRRDGEAFALCVAFPVARDVRVLVVDDNEDLVHFYRRYTTGTRYQVIHVAEGKRVFDAIEATTPDIIVLDVMLPDIDGWDLLTQIHAHPETRSLPIIVCSVVRQEELALALGATLYVPKPVRRQQFITCLDEALSQVAASRPRAHPSSAATC